MTGFGVASGDSWDERGRTDRAEVEVRLRPGAERTLADRVAVILEAARRGRADVFKPSDGKPPQRRFRNNAGGRVALRLHLADLAELGPLPASPRTTRGLPPAGYRVRSTDNPQGTIEPLRHYEAEDNVVVLVRGSSADDRYVLAGWCWGADVVDAELPLDQIESMTTLPLLESLKARRPR